MIPAAVCTHFWPVLTRGCDAGLRAGRDCAGCPAYNDGTAYLGVDAVDKERSDEWARMVNRRLPHAHFREYMA